MSDAAATLTSLLEASGLAAKAHKLDDRMVRLQWGSAVVLVGISGAAVVAIAPMFRTLPTGREQAFYRQMLEYNGYMGGMASFAIQPDGWIVLHAGRALKGLDAQEFAVLVTSVGRFADQFDDQLIAEFFAGDRTAATADA